LWKGIVGVHASGGGENDGSLPDVVQRVVLPSSSLAVLQRFS
jgi:hypothetical protein